MNFYRFLRVYRRRGEKVVESINEVLEGEREAKKKKKRNEGAKKKGE